MNSSQYSRFLDVIPAGDYSVKNHIENDTTLILRHDIDARPERSLFMAQLEKANGIRSTFYCLTKYTNDAFLRRLVSYGHEVGYHYTALAQANGDRLKAEQLFAADLATMRTVVEIKTICAHGSANYRNHELITDALMQRYEIIGDAYLGIDFSSLYYISDSGNKFQLYDHVTQIFDRQKPRRPITVGKIIEYIEKGQRCYLLTHPQYWP